MHEFPSESISPKFLDLVEPWLSQSFVPDKANLYYFVREAIKSDILNSGPIKTAFLQAICADFLIWDSQEKGTDTKTSWEALFNELVEAHPQTGLELFESILQAIVIHIQENLKTSNMIVMAGFMESSLQEESAL